MSPRTNDGSTVNRWDLQGDIPTAYERYLVPAMFSAWARDLVGRASLQPGERVVDVGCGTGVVARHAAPLVRPGGSVVGCDLNPGMLSVARQVVAHTDSRIRWEEADAQSLPFPDSCFDAALSQQTVQFCEDPTAALGEMRRVLAPGGRTVVSVWRGLEHSPGFAIIAGALDRHAGEATADILRRPFAHGDADVLRQWFSAVGFREVRVHVADELQRWPSAEAFVRWTVAATPLAGPVGELAEEAQLALLEEASLALAAYADDDGITLSMESHVVTARR